MKKILFLFAFVILVFGCATIQTKKISDIDKEDDSGFFYSLPKKHLILSFTIEKKTPKKGEFYDIAECFGFDENEIISDEKPIFKITEISNSSKVLPDLTEIYQIQLNQKFLNKTEFELKYSVEGELTSGSLTSTDEIIPLINTVANVAGTLFLSGNFQGGGEKITAANFPCPSLNRNQDRFERANSILKQISAFNTSIADLLEGTDMNMDLETKKYSHEQLIKLRNQLVSKFTGTIKKQTEVLIFEIDPETISANNEILYLEKTSGIDPKMVPYVDSKFTNNNLGEKKKAYKIKVVSKGDELKTAIQNKIYSKKGSLFYRQPSSASFVILLNDKKVKYFKELIPQWGSTLVVPNTLEKISFELHPGLGSIKTIGGISSTLNKGGLNELDSTISGLRGKLKKEDAKDKLIKDLEKDVKIKELQDKLNASSDVQSDVTPEEEN